MCIKHDGRVYKGIINCKYDRLLHIYIFTTRLSANKIKAINSFTEISYLIAMERIKLFLKDLRYSSAGVHKRYWCISTLSTYNKFQMSLAGQPSKFVYSIILCRQIWCDIMFWEYNWKTCSQIWSRLRIRKKKQLYIIKILYYIGKKYTQMLNR